jgi:hypothetical protein
MSNPSQLEVTVDSHQNQPLSSASSSAPPYETLDKKLPSKSNYNAQSNVPSMTTEYQQPQQHQMTARDMISNHYQKSYAHEIQLPPNPHAKIYEPLTTTIGDFFGFLGMFPCIPLFFSCCGCTNPFMEVEQGYVGLISRYGRYYRSVDPGLWRVNVWNESLTKVDVKVQILTVPKQWVMTKDNVFIALGKTK